MSARRGRCSLYNRKALALCLLGGMSATPVRAGPLAILGFGAKGNNAQALAVPTATRNIRMNLNLYSNAALKVLEMKYGKCLEKVYAGGVFAPSALSCRKELADSQKEIAKINLKQEAAELAAALQQQEQRANANIKAVQVNLRKNAEIEKARINKNIASLKNKGKLANAKQIADLEARARNVELKINKYGGAIVKGAAVYAAEAAGEVAGGGVGAGVAGAGRAFMKKTGLSQMATAFVCVATLCAAAIGMVAVAQVSVLGIFRKIMDMIKRILVAGTMKPMMLIKRLIGTTIKYVDSTRSNRKTDQINRNISRVASPTATASGSRASPNSERTITLLNNNSPSGSGVTTRSQSSRNTANSRRTAKSRRTASSRR